MPLLKLQIGKKGLTPEFIDTLKHYFLQTQSIRVSILSSATRDRTIAKAWVEEILSKLGPNYRANLIGYTIVLRKTRKARVE